MRNATIVMTWAAVYTFYEHSMLPKLKRGGWRGTIKQFSKNMSTTDQVHTPPPTCFQSYFFKFLILPGCSFRCYHLFSHEAQGQNVPNSLTVGMVFIAHMFPAAHKQWEVSILILINTSAPIKFRIVKWASDQISSSAPAGTRSVTFSRLKQNPWTAGQPYPPHTYLQSPGKQWPHLA